MRRHHLLVSLLIASCGGPPPPPAVLPAPPPAVAAAPVAPPASRVPDDPVTPLDPGIRVGKLANGMTYYVMKHAKPEDRASLWLAVNAGSVLEDDDQRGLAHLVEHMAFNGTKRFPKADIVNYIEKVGMQFGADVNAYTSFDETVYMLTVPTDDHQVMSTGLDILRDWAGDVAFDPVEVDKERGVVLEEWRLGRGAFARINDKQFPVMFQGSKYGERLPIGKPEIIKGAPRDTLVRFYKDWYRPENMAVIAVGDFDADAIQREIEAKFGDLRTPAHPRPREVVPVPHDQPLAVSIATDPELPFSQVEISDKIDHRRETTRGDFRRFLVEDLYHSMLAARFSELALDPATPFVWAGSHTSSLTRGADGFVRSAQAKQGHTAEALTALVREIERVEAHGFTAAELERARRQMLSRAETADKEWDKTPAPEIADEITRNFLEHEQMGGRAWELAEMRALLPGITLDELDHLARTMSSERGRVVTVSGPATAKLPGEAEVRQLVAAAATEVPAPWQDDAGDHPLMAAAPAPGKVVETAHDDATGATVWRLANGVRVVLKPTTFQNDEVRFLGWQLGGTSLVKDVIHARFAGEIMAESGAGDLDPVALRKALAGKVANARVWLGETSEGVWGHARPADLETALQLLHLELTAPRKDPRAFAAWKADQLEWVRNRRLSPERSFFDDMDAVRYGGHPRRQPTTAAMLDRIDLDKALAVYQDRLADLGGFTFVFVGNVDPQVFQPLAESYLGSLPSHGRKERWRDIGIAYPTGKITKTLVAGTEPKSYVLMAFSAPDRWSADAERDAQILSMVLRIRMREVLREDMGGVYGVSVWAAMSREPTQRRTLSIRFGCDPANVDKLQAAALEIGRSLQRDGIGADVLDKVKSQLTRERETDLRDNNWWLDHIRDAYYFADDFKSSTSLDATLARVTSGHVQAAAKRFFDGKNRIVGVLRPVATASPASPVPSPAVQAPSPAAR